MYKLLLRPTVNKKMVLVEDYVFGGTLVPKGYETDGLSIPWVARLFINRFSPKYLPCAIVHDYKTDIAYDEYTNGGKAFGVILFDLADKTFKEMLTIADGGKLSFKSKLMIKGVKIYHKARYKL